MKLCAATIITLFLSVSARGAELEICMAPNADFAIYGAQSIASRIYERIGIRIRWSREVASCAGIHVNFNDRTPQKQHPGSLAVSAPYRGGEITVYYDRIRAIGRRDSAMLLGYVLAHEIAHVAQGISRHSDTGILKAHWEASDHASMRHGDLRLTGTDIDLIQRGLQHGSTTETGAQ